MQNFTKHKNCTTLHNTELYKTRHKSTQLYTTLQTTIDKKLYKSTHNYIYTTFTKLNKYWHNSTTLNTTLQNVHNATQLLQTQHKSATLLHNTKLYKPDKTLQRFQHRKPKLYNTFYACTQLEKTLQNITKLFTILQNSTTRCNTLHNITKHKETTSQRCTTLNKSKQYYIIHNLHTLVHKCTTL